MDNLRSWSRVAYRDNLQQGVDGSLPVVVESPVQNKLRWLDFPQSPWLRRLKPINIKNIKIESKNFAKIFDFLPQIRNRNIPSKSLR